MGLAAVSNLPTSPDRMRARFDAMRALTRSEPAPSYDVRIERLDKLLASIRKYRYELADAAAQDFGHRSKHETQLADLMPTVKGIEATRKHLRKWMKPKRVPTDWLLWPATSQTRTQPLGVVGIVSPWNYPFQLALAPLTSALAAGNRALIKPSELTPACSTMLEKMLSEAFEPDVVAVIQGGPDVANAFCRLPFDHLVFTGSTRLGHVVMAAAAENLTPVTLELGGKSPAIVHESFDLAYAADRIAAGKMMNAGQTCIAPDYVLVPESKVTPFVEAMRAAISKTHPTLATNPDWTCVQSDRHYARLKGYLEEATKAGAQLVEVNPAGETFDPKTRKFPPTMVLGATDKLALMQDEIFGPILPIVPYKTLDEALAYVNDRPRPLAFYYFDNDRRRVEHVLDRTTAGGVTINATLMHIVAEDLPFGGVGPSGIGAYHGETGYRTLSHTKAVFRQLRPNALKFLSPPYGKTMERMLDFLLGK